MTAHIITIGNEILIGQIIDTHSAFISKELTKLGISVQQISSIADDENHILNTLVSNTSDIVILTGGLGPTKDDITKKTLAQFFGCELTFREELFTHIQYLFREVYKIEMNALNKEQALIPSCAEILFNKVGTASGMWFQKEEKIYISLPGVPFEMKKMLTEKVIPKIKDKFTLPYILQRNLLVINTPESTLSELLNDWENALPKHFSLAYLPFIGRIKLRLMAKGDNQILLDQQLNEQIEQLQPILGEKLQSINDESIEQLVGKFLPKNNLTLAVAESCTGGKISSLLTAQSGASAYYKGGMTTYATESKINLLGISPQTIAQQTVVSESVAIEMAKGVAQSYGATIGLAITGVAGPNQGEDGKSVGTFCIGLFTNEKEFSKTYYIPNLPRVDFIEIASQKAIDFLYHYITTTY